MSGRLAVIGLGPGDLRFLTAEAEAALAEAEMLFGYGPYLDRLPSRAGQRRQASVGLNIVYGQPYERGGIIPHWRGVVDQQGRVQVAIDFNMDVGDSWEWADLPQYPQKLSNLGLRMGVNYVIYAMTH